MVRRRSRIIEPTELHARALAAVMAYAEMPYAIRRRHWEPAEPTARLIAEAAGAARRRWPGRPRPVSWRADPQGNRVVWDFAPATAGARRELDLMRRLMQARRGRAPDGYPLRAGDSCTPRAGVGPVLGWRGVAFGAAGGR
jgi:hypothetical protein